MRILPRRGLLAILGVTAVAAGGPFHAATVEHSLCVEHGEWGHRGQPGRPGVARDDARFERGPDLASAESDEHCQAAGSGNDPGVRPSESHRISSEGSPRVAEALAYDRAPLERAPKTSPPRG